MVSLYLPLPSAVIPLCFPSHRGYDAEYGMRSASTCTVILANDLQFTLPGLVRGERGSREKQSVVRQKSSDYPQTTNPPPLPSCQYGKAYD